MSKKKKYWLIGIGVCLLLYIASIGGGDSNESTEESAPQILKAAQTEIKGDLKGCYTVVDKDYKVTYDYGDIVVTVELMRTSEETPFDRKDVTVYPEAKESSKSMCAGFGIELLDEEGNVVDKLTANHNPYSWDEVKEVLQLLPEETSTIQFRFYDNISSAVSFRITSMVEENEHKNSSLGKAVEKAVEAASELSDNNNADEDENLKKASEAMGAAVDMLDAMNSAIKVMEKIEK